MKKIDVNNFIVLLKYATESFLSKVEEINTINYFPVVDHDTGTNMYSTLKDALSQFQEDANLLVSKLIICSKGNSGIILAKALSGFLLVMLDKNGLESSDDLHHAIVSARDNAYDAVLHPKEGTMLTFLDFLASNNDWEDSEHLVLVINEALEKTLVNGEYDAGAKALYYLIEFTFSLGLDICIPIHSIKDAHPTSTLRYKYCTEFVIACKEKPEKFKAFISKIEFLGDSIAYSYSEGLLKVHIHNNNPFEIFALAKKQGKLVYKKIDNMSLENGEKHPVVFVVDDNGDLFSPFAKFNVEYISLATSTSDSELAHKMSTTYADLVILLTNMPERYKSEKYNHLVIIKTYGILSKASALLCGFNKTQSEYIENLKDFANIYQNCSFDNNDSTRKMDLTDAQMNDLFSFLHPFKREIIS